MQTCISLEAQSQQTVQNFLESTKSYYTRQIADPNNCEVIHFVMGNESADMDSIVSSISYAYLLSQQNAVKKEFYIPLLNLTREEISLRRDVLYLFQLVGITLDNLLFLDDDVHLDALLVQKRLRLDLVDHNVLNPKQQNLSEAVERIIDHHFDEQVQYPLMRSEDKWIMVVGSNTTLVADKILSDNEIEVTPEFAVLLLGPILIDTSNLKSVEKTTQRDIQTVAKLKKLAGQSLPQDFYKTLHAAKIDVSGFTPSMLLGKDFKEYLDGDILYGISSLPGSIKWSVDDLGKNAVLIQKFADDKGLTFFIVLLNGHQKILVYSPSLDLLNFFDDYVRADDKLRDYFVPNVDMKEHRMKIYRSNKVISRKNLQPLFHFSENFKLEPVPAEVR